MPAHPRIHARRARASARMRERTIVSSNRVDARSRDTPLSQRRTELGLARVEGEIELEHVHTWLAEETELPALRVLGHQRTHRVVRYASRPRDARHLVLGRRRTDVRVEAAARRSDEIHRDGQRVL